MTQYPRDEFDDVPEVSSRQGVHREHLAAPTSGSLGLMILAGLLALLVGLAAYFVLPGLGIGDGENSGPNTSVTTPASAFSANGSSSSEPSNGAPLSDGLLAASITAGAGPLL